MMRTVCSVVPNWCVEAVARTAGYFARVAGSGRRERIENRLRGAIIGRRHGGLRTSLGARCNIVGGRTVVFGKGVSINEGTQLVAGSTGYVHMGDSSHVSRNSVLAGAGGITVGAGTKISSGVMVYTVTYDRSDGRRLRELPSQLKPVVIGADVHIGANATILPGVTIGDDAIVGAGAVVSRDVPAGVTVVGVPARPVGGG